MTNLHALLPPGREVRHGHACHGGRDGGVGACFGSAGATTIDVDNMRHDALREERRLPAWARCGKPRKSNLNNRVSDETGQTPRHPVPRVPNEPHAMHSELMWQRGGIHKHRGKQRRWRPSRLYPGHPHAPQLGAVATGRRESRHRPTSARTAKPPATPTSTAPRNRGGTQRAAWSNSQPAPLTR